MRKDILLKLYQYGELNQTKLMSFCGLNNVKHREILDDMVDKGLIVKRHEQWGDTSVIMYKASERGMKILRELLEPYEELFPRGPMNAEVKDEQDRSGGADGRHV
jgi:predicted transcriptional regulator